MRQLRIVKERAVTDENGNTYNIVVEDYVQELPDPTPDQLRAFRVDALERVMEEARTTLNSSDFYKFYLATRYLREEYLDLLPTFEMWLRGLADDEYGVDFTTTGFPSKSYYSAALRDAILAQIDESSLVMF